MSKPFLIINVVDGELGVIRERPNFEEAVDVAVKMALEQSDDLETHIREELERDTDWLSPNRDIHIYIAQTHDD